MSKKMFHGRFAAAGVLTLSAVLMLAGCGGSKDKKAEEAASKAEAAVSKVESAVEAAASKAESAAEAVVSKVGSAAEAVASKAGSAAEAVASKAEAAVEETVSAAAVNAENEESVDTDVVLDEDLGGDEDLGADDIEWEEFDYVDEDEEEEELSPEQKELNEYIEANYSDALMEQYDSLRYEQIMWDKEGKENSMTGYVYIDKDLIYVDYVDGFKEIITEKTYDGFDPELNLPVRYVFADPTTREDNVENYQELFYLWGDETIEGREETEEKVTFTTRTDDIDFIEYIVDGTDIEAEEGDSLLRETQFDKATKLMELSHVKYCHADGSEADLFECKFIPNPEKGYEEDTELTGKLNSEDTHSLTLTIDPGKEEETVIEAKVGKGCAFLPLLYDGYTYYTDKECTLAASDEELYETEGDLVLYAAFEEIPEEELDLDDDTYELEIDGDEELDLSDLFEVVDDGEAEE